jgi:hypothetical protein
MLNAQEIQHNVSKSGSNTVFRQEIGQAHALFGLPDSANFEIWAHSMRCYAGYKAGCIQNFVSQRILYVCLICIVLSGLCAGTASKFIRALGPKCHTPRLPANTVKHMHNITNM